MAAANTTRHTRRKTNWKKRGWKVGLAAALIAAGYNAWLLISIVVGSDLTPHFKMTSRLKQTIAVLMD